MVSTKAGDRIDNLLHNFHELSLTGLQAHYKLIIQAYCNFDNPSANDTFAAAMKATNLLMTQRIDAAFSKAYQATQYVNTGKRVSATPARVRTPDFTRTAMISGPQNGYKKIVANVGLKTLTPQEYDDTVNYSAQSSAQATMAPVKQAQIDRVVESSTSKKVWYARRPEGSACDFCMGLAMKGAVYSTKPRFHSHNNCRCTPVVSDEPIQFDPETRDRVNKWVDAHRASLNDSGRKRDNTRDRDKLVEQGLRKRVVRNIPVYKDQTDEFGNVTKVQVGTRQQVTYQPTQKAKQLQQISADMKTKGYQRAMNPAEKPEHAPNITPADAKKEVDEFREFVEIKNGKGEPLNVISNMEDYRIWADKMGVLDERLIKAATYNRAAAKVSYEQAVKRVAAEKLAKLLDDLQTRIGYLQRNNPLVFEDVHPISFWQQRFSGHDVDALKVALTRSGIVYR